VYLLIFKSVIQWSLKYKVWQTGGIRCDLV